MKPVYRSLIVSLTAFAVVPVSASLYTGKEGGNGGNALVCFDRPEIAEKLTPSTGVVATMIPDRYLQNISSITALDLYEARRPKSPQLPTPEVEPMFAGEGAEAYARRLAGRYASVQIGGMAGTLSLPAVLRLGQETFGDRVYHEKTSPLYAANDIAPLIRAMDGCVYATVAVQRSIGGNKRELAFDDRLYYHPRHSELSRGVLLVHEYFLAAYHRLAAPTVQLSPTTEGVREWVANFIQLGKSAEDLSEIIVRRGLFWEMRNAPGSSSVSEGFARVNPLTELFIDLQQAHRDARTKFLTEHRKAFESKFRARYELLPKKYRKHSPIGQIDVPSDLDTCVRWFLNYRDSHDGSINPVPSRTKCLKGDDLENLHQLQNQLAQLEKSFVTPGVIAALELTRESRERRFAEAMVTLQASTLLTEELAGELQELFRETIRTGTITPLVESSGKLARYETGQITVDQKYLRSGN